MQLYNSLTRKKDEFVPMTGKQVGMYTCGPTVYDYVTVGNWRTYVLSDVLYRCLKYEGYEIKSVMNVTDVGHLTGDNLGDADTGEDRMEKATKREGKNAWEIAEFYTSDFMEGLMKLNFVEPQIVRATDHIREQIALVKQIESAGFAYEIKDGIYFDVRAYEKVGFEYGEISTLDQIKEGARVEANPEKRDPRDFALWKFSYKGGRSFDSAQDDVEAQRHMEWDSPWGKGFPGWHIECSAMSMKYLGEQFDIHVGGEDLRSIHHTNEIVQSQAATSKVPFVKYWVHGGFLLVNGGRMGKSLGNAYRLQDLEAKGFDVLALRYLYFTAHYRKQLNFTWDSLKAAETALKKLSKQFREMQDSIQKKTESRTTLSAEKLDKVSKWQLLFRERLEDDLDMPGAVAVMWEMLKDNISEYDKVDLLLDWDQILGLGLAKYQISAMPSGPMTPVRPSFGLQRRTEQANNKYQISEEVELMVKKREQLRLDKKWDEADELRKKIGELGFVVEDKEGRSVVRRK